MLLFVKKSLLYYSVVARNDIPPEAKSRKVAAVMARLPSSYASSSVMLYLLNLQTRNIQIHVIFQVNKRRRHPLMVIIMREGIVIKLPVICVENTEGKWGA